MATINGTGSADVLNGTAGNDTISGLGGNDTLNGGDGNDVLFGGVGDDTLNGGSGSDSALYGGNMSGYRLQWVGGAVRVVDVNAADGNMGTDSLTGVERISFGDGVLLLNNAYSEFRVNTTTAGAQENAVVTALADGSFVVVWASADAQGEGIFAQRFGQNGAPLGAQFPVNTTTANGQLGPSVTALADGGFLVSWESEQQDDVDGSTGIYAQRYDANGVAQGGEFLVNATTLNDQIETSIAGLTGGGFVAVWAADAQDGDGFGIYAQIFDADGDPVGSEFRVNTETDEWQLFPTVTALADGGFVVTWTSDLQDGDDFGVYAQVYEADGDPVGVEFRVNTTTNAAQYESTVCALQDGGFVIAWQSEQTVDGLSNVFAQRFDSNGGAVGTEFLVNTFTTLQQQNPAIASLIDGGFVITWSSDAQDGDQNGIYAQRYDADGAPMGGEFRVNTHITDHQVEPRITGMPDGGFVITWTSIGQDGSGAGVYAQRYDSAGRTYTMEVQGDVGQNTLSFAGASARMVGMDGDDRYIVDDAGDSVIETFDEGTDTVESAVTYSLGIYLEHLILTGSANINGTGNDSNNNITGNSGNNRLDGGLGNDVYAGGLGNDMYVLTAGDTVTEALNAGTDTVFAGFNYTLGANVENLTVIGATGIVGTGNALNNRLAGGAGNDTFSGAGGNDNVTGGAGNDSLNGGDGADVLIGGAGADRFAYGSITNSTVAAAGRDTLQFVRADGDKIVLTAIDADTDGTAGNQAFLFIGSAAFSGVDGQLRFAASGGNTIVYGDVNGDTVADFSILISGNISLLASDFLL